MDERAGGRNAGPNDDAAEGRAVLLSDEELDLIRAAVERRRPEYLADLAALVATDSGSYDKAGVDRVGRHVASLLTALGAEVRTVPDDSLGETVVGSLAGGGSRSLLLIGHLDTVFEAGTAAARPFAVDGSRATGPGVSDMKAGLLAGLYALLAIRDTLGTLPVQRLVFLANPDEEIGSPVSTPVIRAEAATADACLVLEAARENGDVVSARKGMVDLEIEVKGRAAHAGVEPEKGRSAIVEAAHLVLALTALNGRWPGVTCNVGVIRGGTRPNVVADEAVLQVDLRATTREGLAAAEEAIRAATSTTTVPDTTALIRETSRHWPMERLAGSMRLVHHAQRLAGRLGFPLADAATGGASDANTTAGMGVPTLDGLGPIGGLDHSPSEYLDLDSVVPRTTLLACLIVALGRDEAPGRESGPG